MIADYVRQYRKNHAFMIASIWTILLSMVVVIALSDAQPTDSTLWWTLTPLFVLVMLWWVWTNQRAIVRPERELARSAPVSSALTKDEAQEKALSQISYGGLATIPFAGLLIVVLAMRYFDVWTGWGRLVWLAPIAFLGLAARQAMRKYRLENRS